MGKGEFYMSIRVGFASGDGRHIDQRLLCGSDWWIYDVGDTVRFVEKRILHSACDVKCTECGDRSTGGLKDCDLLFMRGVDRNEADEVLSGSTRIILTQATVKDLLEQVASRNRQKISIDYYRRVQELSQAYGKPAGF